MYHNGHGVPKDLVEAYKWYSLAAAQGNNNALSNRDNLIRWLTPQQIAEGQQRAATAVSPKARNR
jgi:TPR repeat protein